MSDVSVQTGRLEAGLEKALAGLPTRLLHAAAAIQQSLRAVICELGRGPQLWTVAGKAVVLAGDFSGEELDRAVQAMAPWGDDGTSGVDGELHFRMLLTSATGPRGLVVYLHRHRQPDTTQLAQAVKRAVHEHRAALLVVGSPEAREHVLREIANITSATLGLSTVLVDPQGKIGGRGRVPDRSIGPAAWVPAGGRQEVLAMASALLTHARPRVLITDLDSADDVSATIAGGGGTLLVLGTPLSGFDAVPDALVELASRWPVAAVLAREDGGVEGVSDLRKAVARARR